MAISADRIYATLNHLIELLIDSEEGFRRAAAAAKNPDLRLILQETREERAGFATELRMLVTRMGGKPEAEGTMRGDLHRTWVNLKLALQRDRDHALIIEAQRAENMTLAEYRKALNQDLPAAVDSVLSNQLAKIQDALSQIRGIPLQRAGA